MSGFVGVRCGLLAQGAVNQSLAGAPHLDEDIGHGAVGSYGPAALGRDQLKGGPCVTRTIKDADLQQMLANTHDYCALSPALVM